MAATPALGNMSMLLLKLVLLHAIKRQGISAYLCTCDCSQMADYVLTKIQSDVTHQEWSLSYCHGLVTYAVINAPNIILESARDKAEFLYVFHERGAGLAQ
jgi:hypothetical protein